MRNILLIQHPERTASILIQTVFSLSPLLVSVTSFTVFVYTGHRLTVPIAFTAIQLFNMIRNPMNVIPVFGVQAVQTGVSLDRIDTFLEEDEVPNFVSSLMDTEENHPEDERLGISRGYFQWNRSPKEAPKEESKSKASWWKFWKKSAPVSQIADIIGENDDSDASRFELQDINVIFPSGKLTVVTGPTGKIDTLSSVCIFNGHILGSIGKNSIVVCDSWRVDPIKACWFLNGT